MALNIQKKQKIIDEIHKIAKLATSLILAEVQNISVNNITQLRKSALKSEVKINIVKNTLFKLAIRNTPFECLVNDIKGPNLVAFSMNHPGSAAKLLQVFKKKHVNCKIKIGVFEKKILSKSAINELSNMPTYEEVLIHMIVLLREITVAKLIRALRAVQHKKSIINI
ncbi:50S ribosomal protein L10 [Buchnera aphidicola (Nipponaphis monzeni)]|uniref:Large ribosomal subunit protein uL10 n=1 Tax=Buchnera aphidicola (Nipponaphis monzeni) TaxID=2495405 RepID=A0A455T9N2_9GAMM|nr:50S ribosomal protein L10 [Buchnera aphidicola]BBI01048.1 50S ribosomal protein L10 [Buchnera aphidicola (Nipponaphis monzeni)]